MSSLWGPISPTAWNRRATQLLRVGVVVTAPLGLSARSPGPQQLQVAGEGATGPYLPPLVYLFIMIF